MSQPLDPQSDAERPGGRRQGPADQMGALSSLEPGAAGQALRLSGGLLIVGTVVYAVVTPLLHPGGGADPTAEFEGYAHSRSWEIAHTLQFASWVILAFGWAIWLLVISRRMRKRDA